MYKKIIVCLVMAVIMLCLGCLCVFADDITPSEADTLTTTSGNAQNNVVSDIILDDENKYTDQEDNTENPVKTTGLTEEEANAMIEKIAEAVGKYSENIPAAKTAKEWILRNASNIIGFLMALSLLIATPTGSSIYKNAKMFIKKNVDGTLTTIEAWKENVEKTLNETSTQSKDLSNAVKDLIRKYDEIADARARAEEAQKKAEAELMQATEKMTVQEEKTAATNQAMLASTVLLARTMTTVVQLSKALTQQQKDEFYEAYKSAMADIKDLTDNAHTDANDAEGTNEVQNN